MFPSRDDGSSMNQVSIPYDIGRVNDSSGVSTFEDITESGIEAEGFSNVRSEKNVRNFDDYRTKEADHVLWQVDKRILAKQEILRKKQNFEAEKLNILCRSFG